jgi:uncharacterized repeat protein (TIGR01451 family)
MVPYGRPATLSPRPGVSNGGQVQYWGGPVISNVHVVEVLWGNFVDAPTTSGLSQFYTDISSSNYFSLLAEYGTVGLTEFGTTVPGSNQTVGPGVFDGKFTISPSLCPGAANNPVCSIDDTQIQTELTSQLEVGHLPQAVQDAQGNFNTLYMIYFPPGVRISVQGLGSCVPFGFCAYHSNVTANLKPKLPYGVFPDFGPTSACSTGCGLGTAAQNLTAASTHELGEAVTDTDVGAATALAPPLGWVDQVSGQEIGDFCEGNSSNDVTVSAGGNTYTVQQLWSNMQNACVSAPAHFQLTAQANANPGKAFNITATPESSVDSSTLTGYNNTVHFTSSDQAPVLPADYTFVPSTDAGSHVFSVTLSSSGSQTVTVTDTQVRAMTGNVTVAISNFPDLTVTSMHAGSFTQGQTGANYTLTVSNVGNLPTSNPVTLVDSLPASISATAISGSGWSCALGTLTCSRSDVLAANASYPPITLTVNVDPAGPTPVVNNVQVSLSGDLNATNDSAMDSTVVVQLADLTILKTHTGSFGQGQKGETYTLTVINVGRGPSTGIVTVADNLPSGLTAAALSGTGWTCALGTVSCARVDVLGPNGLSYPPITVTVNIDPSATIGTVVNSATVSGGGEIITSNDSASDPTVITPPAPDMTITITHSGDFTQGLSGAYSITVGNGGPVPTTGTVTVTDNLPSGVAATAAVGSGWSCAVPTSIVVTCTRSDALAPSSSYPAITLSVGVSPNAPALVTNVAMVSGGGELDSGETASDATNIIQLPVLDMTLIEGNNLVQGATNSSWLQEPRNTGDGATSGLITVTESFNPGVTLTAISGFGWNCVLSTMTCTRSDPQPPHLPLPFINVTLSYATTITQVTQTLTITGGGELSTNNTFVFTEALQPSVVVSANSGTATVTAGSAATFGLLVTDNLTSPVTLGCGAPLPPGTTCNFSPQIVSFLQTQVTLSVTTSGPGLASGRPFGWNQVVPVYVVLFPLLGLIATAPRRKGSNAPLVLGSILTLLILTSCGGGSKPPPPIVTPPGTYTITVTATNTGTHQQASVPVTLIVK